MPKAYHSTVFEHSAGRDPGQPPVAFRVYLNPHVDLELTEETARAYAAADERGQRDMAEPAV